MPYLPIYYNYNCETYKYIPCPVSLDNNLLIFKTFQTKKEACQELTKYLLKHEKLANFAKEKQLSCCGDTNVYKPFEFTTMILKNANSIEVLGSVCLEYGEFYKKDEGWYFEILTIH